MCFIPSQNVPVRGSVTILGLHKTKNYSTWPGYRSLHYRCLNEKINFTKWEFFSHCRNKVTEQRTGEGEFHSGFFQPFRSSNKARSKKAENSHSTTNRKGFRRAEGLQVNNMNYCPTKSLHFALQESRAPHVCESSLSKPCKNLLIFKLSSAFGQILFWSHSCRSIQVKVYFQLPSHP